MNKNFLNFLTRLLKTNEQFQVSIYISFKEKSAFGAKEIEGEQI